MMRCWLAMTCVAAVLVGCAAPPSEPMMEPVFETGSGALTEPAMAPVIVERSPAGITGPTLRPRARPASLERCNPGDDGIGGTGCRVD